MLGGCCTINTTDERDMVTQTKGKRRLGGRVDSGGFLVAERYTDIIG